MCTQIANVEGRWYPVVLSSVAQGTNECSYLTPHLILKITRVPRSPHASPTRGERARTRTHSKPRSLRLSGRISIVPGRRLTKYRLAYLFDAESDFKYYTCAEHTKCVSHSRYTCAENSKSCSTCYEFIVRLSYTLFYTLCIKISSFNQVQTSVSVRRRVRF